MIRAASAFADTAHVLCTLDRVVGLQLLSENENVGDDDELQNTADHGEQRRTRFVGIPEGREGKIFCEHGEYDTEAHAGKPSEIEDDLIEGGIAVAVGQGHIDVLEIRKGYVMSHTAEMLGKTDNEHQGDVKGNGQRQRGYGKRTGLYKAVDDLQGGYNEQGNGKHLEPRGVFDLSTPKFHEKDEKRAVSENDDVIKRLGYADIIEQIVIELRGIAVQGKLPEKDDHHGQHKLFVFEGNGNDVRKFRRTDHGIFHFTREHEEDHVHNTQTEGEIAQRDNKPVGETVTQPSRAEHEHACNHGGGKLADRQVIRAYLFGLESDVPCGISRRGDHVEKAGKEGEE